MKDITIILASNSPRRRELLRQIGVEPEIRPSNIDEQVTSQIPEEVVMELSLQKAEDVAAGAQAGTLILGADTVVAVDGKILGKPKSHEEAADMIRMIQGRAHQDPQGGDRQQGQLLRGEDGCFGVPHDRGGDKSLRGFRRTHGQGRGLRDPGEIRGLYRRDPR